MANRGSSPYICNETRRARILPTDILIVAHVPSSNTEALARATLAGAMAEEFGPLNVRLATPSETTAEHVLDCRSIIIGSTENFGYMAGLIKDFFERIYYPCIEKTDALPCALYIRAGTDGTGTRVSIEKIIAGLKWKPVQNALILRGNFHPDFISQCEELGQTMAAGLEAGIF